MMDFKTAKKLQKATKIKIASTNAKVLIMAITRRNTKMDIPKALNMRTRLLRDNYSSASILVSPYLLLIQ